MSFIINRMSDMSIVPPNLLQRRRSDISLNFEEFGSKLELFNIRTVPIRNAKKESYHEKKILLIETFMTFLNILVIIITIFKNFDFEKNEDQYEISEDEVVEYKFLLIFCLCVVILNITRKLCVVQMKNETEEEHQQKTFNLWSKITIESIFYVIHPTYLTKNLVFSHISPDFHFNKILSCFVYFRIINIFCFFFKISRFYGLRVKRVLNLHIGDRNDFGILYTIKCHLKENGIKSPFIVYAAIILAFPFFLMVLQEKYLIEGSSLLNFNGFLEAVYDIVITMTTVGYGDMGHCFTFERILFSVIIIAGSISSSFFTLTFLNWVEFSVQEEKAFRSITRLSIKKKINEINNKKVEKFVETFIKIHKNAKCDKKKSVKEIIDAKTQGNEYQIEHNEIEMKKPNKNFQILLPYMARPELKQLNQCLDENQDTFRDFYERNQEELNQSIKLLIERVLLTGNLMEFYLMRHHKNLKKYGDESEESIKSRRRVDDNAIMYELKMKIIEATYRKEENKTAKALVTTSEKVPNHIT